MIISSIWKLNHMKITIRLKRSTDIYQDIYKAFYFKYFYAMLLSNTRTHFWLYLVEHITIALWPRFFHLCDYVKHLVFWQVPVVDQQVLWLCASNALCADGVGVLQVQNSRLFWSGMRAVGMLHVEHYVHCVHL